MEVTPFTYLIGSFIAAFPWWLALYLWKKELRTRMLVMGLIVGALAPLWAPFFFDYWHPLYLFPLHLWTIELGSIEDFLYGFFAGGIATAIYESLFPLRVLKLRDRHHHWKWFVFPLALISLASFHGLLFAGINSIYAAIVMLVIMGMFICSYRHDLVYKTLITGAVCLAMTFVGYLAFIALFPTVVIEWWHLDNISNILVIGIPIEELLWAFCLGAVTGTLYDFYMGIRYRKRK